MLVAGAAAAVLPAAWVVRYVAATQHGVVLVVYWVALLVVVVPVMHWVAHHCSLPIILVRKVGFSCVCVKKRRFIGNIFALSHRSLLPTPEREKNFGPENCCAQSL